MKLHPNLFARPYAFPLPEKGSFRGFVWEVIEGIGPESIGDQEHQPLRRRLSSVHLRGHSMAQRCFEVNVKHRHKKYQVDDKAHHEQPHYEGDLSSLFPLHHFQRLS